jgi:uncharacterized protein
MVMTTQTSGKQLRGFAAMDKDRLREISAQGGRAVPAEKRTFTGNPTLAREAGRKGAEARNKTVADRQVP